MNIAQKLQELLTESGISRSRLARELGVHTSTVTNWIEGRPATSKHLAAICAFFGCSLDYLTGTVPEAPEPLTPAQTEAVELIRSMSDEELARFIKMARVMLDK